MYTSYVPTLACNAMITNKHGNQLEQSMSHSLAEQVDTVNTRESWLSADLRRYKQTWIFAGGIAQLSGLGGQGQKENLCVD